MRPSRLHTEAGQFCGIDSLPGLVPATATWLTSRLIGKYALEPWWVYGAARKMHRLLRQEDQVLEIGSGYSTLWLSQRCQRVYSLETSVDWFHLVERELDKRNRSNVHLQHVSEVVPEMIRDLLEETRFDVVVVDGPDDRPALLATTLAAASPPRLVVFDDTDMAQYRPALAAVGGGYDVCTFRGFKPQTVHACETSILVRAK